MKNFTLPLILLLVTFLGFNSEITAQLTSSALGTSTSSSATRGPFQRSSSSSSSVYSRANLVYTAAELSSIGIVSGTTISQINWDLGSTNQITASGDATLTIYMKNTANGAATTDTWANHIAGATAVGTYTFNTSNNFPGAEGFLGFPLTTSFVYTGGSIEVAVDWDCSNLVPADPGQPNLLFSGNGSLNWHWSSTAHNSLTYSASSSQPSSTGNLKSERVNTQFVYTPAPGSAQSLTIGSGTSSSATRGPFQRSSSSSSSVYSRANLVYTASELSGLVTGSTINQISFDLGSTNVITASGDATMTIYMKNSSATDATADTWANHISGAIQVGTYTFNTANNFPGAEGFLDFPLSTSFVYTGGTIEVAVDWDCSNLVPADPGQPNLLFSGNGSLNWHWSGTTHNSLTYSASSSQPSSTGNVKAERVNTQFEFTTAIPVEMTYFTGQATNDGNLLEWETLTELNNEGFQIEKSLDGKTWNRIDFVAGNGTDFEVNNYTYFDTRVDAEQIYYRIKQIDFNGAFEYSNAILITNTFEQKDIRTYPNPVYNQLTVEGFRGIATIYNVLGQPLKTIQITNDVATVSFSDLQNGHYVLELVNDNGTITVEHILKLAE